MKRILSILIIDTDLQESVTAIPLYIGKNSWDLDGVAFRRYLPDTASRCWQQRLPGHKERLLQESLGLQAIDQGLSVSWLSLEDFGTLRRRHYFDDSVNTSITRVINVNLIWVHDMFLLPVSGDAAESFYRLVEASSEKRSPATSSNVYPSGFDELLLKTIATTTVDRLMQTQDGNQGS